MAGAERSVPPVANACESQGTLRFAPATPQKRREAITRQFLSACMNVLSGCASQSSRLSSSTSRQSGERSIGLRSILGSFTGIVG